MQTSRDAKAIVYVTVLPCTKLNTSTQLCRVIQAVTSQVPARTKHSRTTS